MGDFIGTVAHYKNTREAVLVQKSIIEALWRLCWYNRVLLEHSGGCAGTEECNTRTWENVLVQWYTIRALERLCCYISFYRKTGAVLAQKSNIGALERLCWQSRAL